MIVSVLVWIDGRSVGIIKLDICFVVLSLQKINGDGNNGDYVADGSARRTNRRGRNV